MAFQSAFHCCGSSCGAASATLDGAAAAGSADAGAAAVAFESGVGAGGSVSGAADAGEILVLVAGVPPPSPWPDATSEAAGGPDEVVAAGAATGAGLLTALAVDEDPGEDVAGWSAEPFPASCPTGSTTIEEFDPAPAAGVGVTGEATDWLVDAAPALCPTGSTTT